MFEFFNQPVTVPVWFLIMLAVIASYTVFSHLKRDLAKGGSVSVRR